MNMSMWVLYSERPILFEELCHALGVKIGSTDLDPENIPFIRTLISSCQGLVTGKRSSNLRGSSSTVQLVHLTLREHLLSDPTLFHSPHSSIAEVCRTYLNYAFVRDLSPTLDQCPQRAWPEPVGLVTPEPGRAGPAYRPYRPSLVRSWRAAVRSPRQKFKINKCSFITK